MCISKYDELLLQAFYDYNRIPLWIYDQNFHLQKIFFDQTTENLSCLLTSHIETLLPDIAHPDFDIMCYENELYSIFSYSYRKKTFYVFCGPMLLSGFHTPTSMKTLSFAPTIGMKTLEQLVRLLPIISLSTFSSCFRIAMLLLCKKAPTPEAISGYLFSNLGTSIEHTFTRELFENREDFRIHSPYRHEIALLNCVKEGDSALLESTFKTLPETKYGNMSNAPLRQLFYGCIANTTLVTRYAIEGGLDEETAFTLSDVYIKQMELCQTLYELTVLNEKMALDFTAHVAKSKTTKRPVYLEPVAKCIHYILINLHTKITLPLLAKEVNLTPKYLSYLFHQEIGQTVTSFIEQKRVEEAKRLLLYTDYTFSEISNYLAFHSHSYFIHIFKKHTTMTPRMYRQNHIHATC